ncbi:MAG: peptidylprolyl isomerase [Rhodoferax sp.]
MTYRLKTLTLAALMLVAAMPAQPQGLRPPGKPPVTGSAAVDAPTPADFIVAVVNSEPVTNNQVRLEMARTLQQFAQQNRPQPDLQALAAEVLENLINRKAQLQFARDTGLRAEESAVDQAEQSIALQNQLDLAELRRRVVREGQTVKEFRAELADQILLQRLRERDVESRVRVSDLEVAQYQAQQQSVPEANAMQLNLAHILVAVPESATPAQVEALRSRAQRALERARSGADFAALVREFSQASDVANGGQLGLRPASRYPELFVQATQQLGVGDVAALVRSPAGFHVLKVVEKLNTNAPTMAVTQSRARHILLVPGPRLSELEARQKLADFKKRVLARQADFASLAREHSQDGSAARGGDLGWANPGMFVPEFEDAMNRLAPGEISDPVLSRFGVHLIALEERRKATLNPEQQREALRTMLREKKLGDAYRAWAQDIRGRAYVEIREPPL